jgi:ABC-2 type transport system permease protein
MSTVGLLARTGRAEWSRIWSVRSSWAFALATAIVVVGFAAVLGSDAAADPSGVSAGSSAWDGGRMTAMFALFGIVALSVVVTTADHGTGGIVPTLQWTPRRGVLLAARTVVVATTATALGLVLVAAAGLTVWAYLPELGLPVGDGARTLGEIGLVLGAGALLGVGLGLLTRSTAVALVAALALLLVLPPLVAQLPAAWAVTVAAHLPGSGALFLIFGEGPSDDMTSADARLTLAAWAAAALAAGGRRLLRSDAHH